MRRTLGLCFAMLLGLRSAHAERVAADELHLFASYADGAALHYVIHEQQVARAPDWSGEGSPPLSQETATSMALAKHRQRFATSDARVRKVGAVGKRTHCSRDVQCPDTLWYYKVKIAGEPAATYVILMDGQFVEPR